MKNKFILILSAVATPTPFIRATTTQIQWPPSPMGTSLTPNTQFHEFISYIYEWGISLGGIAVFIVLVWAGIQYLTSAGDPGQMGDAIKRIKSSILGLILLLTSWLILNTINPQLVRLAPLPSLWETADRLLGARIDISQIQAPPCDFVVVWNDINFVGDKSDPIVFEKGERIRRIEGDRKLDDHINRWMSARNFIELTREEEIMLEREEKERENKRLEFEQNLVTQGIPPEYWLQMISEFRRRTGDPSIWRYNDKGERYDKGMYKEGGLCVIDLFQTTRELGVCGGNIGRVELPGHDFRLANTRNIDVTCVEIVRSVPDGFIVREVDETIQRFFEQMEGHWPAAM